MPEVRAYDDAFYDAVFEHAPVAIWLEDFSDLRDLFARWRADGVDDIEEYLAADLDRLRECFVSMRDVRVNRATLELFAAGSFEELRDSLSAIYPPEAMISEIGLLVALWKGDTEWWGKIRNSTLDGRRMHLLTHTRVLSGHEDTWDAVVSSLEDVTELVETEAKLEASRQYAELIFDEMPGALWVEDLSHVKRRFDVLRLAGVSDLSAYFDDNPDFVHECITSIRVKRVSNQTLALYRAHDIAELSTLLPDFASETTLGVWRTELQRLWSGQLRGSCETSATTIDRRRLDMLMEWAVVPGYEATWEEVLVTQIDITERKVAQEHLEHLSTHDPLTGLSNRGAFVEELGRLDADGRRPVAVVALDLNGLKSVNDEHGHLTGDELLGSFGELIARSAPMDAIAARTGGDEFAVLIPGGEEDDADAFVTMLRSLTQEQSVPGKPALSFSAGSHVARDGIGLHEALHHADLAMYDDKRRHYGERRQPSPPQALNTR